MMRMFGYLRTFNPRWVITLLVVTVIAINFIQPQWSRREVITGDVKKYYDVLLRFTGGAADTAVTAAHMEPDDLGALDPQIGMAVSYAPFYGLAWIAARAAGTHGDPYSSPFQFAIQFSSLVYFVIGLIFLSKLLRLHFPGLVCSLTILMLSLGTNALYYLTAGAGLPHAVVFTLVVLFLYQAIAWHQIHDFSSAVQLGLLLGSIWIVRPVASVVVIAFLLYDVRRVSEIQFRLRLLRRRLPPLLIALLCTLAVIAFQWLLGPASDGWGCDKDDFYSGRPAPLDGLLASENGLLVYTPIVLVCIAGCFFLRGYLRMYARAIPLTLIAYTLLALTVCTVQSSTFSQRFMIDIYPLLAIPLAALTYKLRRLGGAYRWSLYIAFVALLLLNFYLTCNALELM